ncbi:MAG: hypothetical protein AAGF26_06635 [Cyanobacteria bacterium P01_G01_bin.49]
MKNHLALVTFSLLSVTMIIPIRTNAQTNVGPNISVPPRECAPGAVNCDAEIHRENMRYNRQLYFQTPEKIIQNFHRDRTQRACLERTITTPPPPPNPNCGEYLDRIETLNQQDPLIEQRQLQQQEIDRLYPSVPK